ncbi:MAG: tyrosine-type recombinase/integrase [Anaerolineales bacterium]
MILPTLATLLQSFFLERLLQQRRASPHTIASYRDTFRLLLNFAKDRLGKNPSELELAALDAPFLGKFLSYLETERRNSPRTRNVRLAALHSFFRYVALRDPTHAQLCQRVLAMPPKKHEKRPIDYLNQPEIEALLAAPDTSTWIGRRDRTLLSLALQTGLRLSELIGLRCQDLVLETGAHVRCDGKGRKQRCTPLRRDVVTLVKAWLRERQGHPQDPLFPSLRGGPLSRDAVEQRVAKYAAIAQKRCPSLKGKQVTPHVLRHSLAMDLLHHGIDRSVIALWLGHESIETTEIYLHADLRMKERALSRTTPRFTKPARYRPTDKLLAFLEGL